MLLQKGDRVWLDNTAGGEFDVPIGAVVEFSDSGQLKLIDDDKVEHWIDPRRDKDKIKPMHQTSAEGVEDMIQLGDLTESGIMHNVQMRYHDRMIYTYTGSILVALNPYKVLPIYDQEHILRYTNKRIGEESPHIFAIADNAYHFMVREQKDQCVVITGESGAGKTESTKLILQFLAHVSGQHTWIEQQILDTNPILETFGNARTGRNDNSSRFGKYIDVHFDKGGHIEGAMIQQYLLEKSRIVNQLEGERNYHIFYRLLAGLSEEELKQLGLVKDPWKYHYLTRGNTVKIDDPNFQDFDEFKHATGAMTVCQFSKDDLWNIWSIVSCVMNLGNIQFEETEKRNMPVAYVEDRDSSTIAARMLQVSVDDLEKALCTRSTITHGETIVSPLSAAVAANVRDAFVKGIYGRMFIWIVKKLNEAIYKPTEGKQKKHISIGVLDIFGFEAFGKNSFEQMCINYCNENLQQFFVRHIFKLEQMEYDKERINWSLIEFKDNQEILDLLGQKPLNIIALIDEESRFPKGTDDSMLDKLHKQHSKHPHYIKPKSQARRAFGIRHFAGDVYYDADEFLEKNRDTFSADLFDLLHGSKSKFLLQLFSGERAMTSETRKKAPTLGLQFKQSLDALMRTLEACQPFFVRCIKPNEDKSPLAITRELCVRQLRYSGMMETIRIRRAGYPIRHLFHHFVERYQYLVPQLLVNYPDLKTACKVVCKKVLGDKSDYQIGVTKIFLKDQDDQKLEETREIQLTRRVVIIQKTFRGYKVRKQYVMLRKAAILVQKNWRRLQISREYRKMKRGFLRLQATFRGRKVRKWYLRTHSRIVRFQRRCKGWVVRDACRRQMRAIVRIQSLFRVILAFKIAAKRRIEKKRREEAERLRREEEERLKREMAAEEAKKAAEKLHQERLAKMEKEEREEEERKRREAQAKAEYAKRKAEDALKGDDDKVVEDSEIVGEIFGFLDTPKNGVEEATGGDPGSIPLPDDDEDISEYKFAKFAATYFQGSAITHSWTKKKIKQPLLALKHDVDNMLALDIWIMILRFMGDLREPAPVEEPMKEAEAPKGLRKKVSTLGRKFLSNNNKLIAEAAGVGAGGLEPEEEDEQSQSRGEEKRKESLRRRLVSMTLKKVTKVPQEVVNIQESGGSAIAESSRALHRPTTNLEKLHFIIGFGILRPELRDEIYCQICKQLTQNPSRSSHARGWVLLSLCVGCFAPSSRLIKYLRCFISEGPPGYAPYCEERLRRTLMNGARQQPPSWLELQATKSKKPLMLPITFMDGSTKALLADSATTAKELCTLLAQRIGMKDPFGFSLYIALFDKVSSLGSEGDHIMDAISQCEQYAKEMGAQERSAPWRLFFRKEIFSPWHDPAEDPVGTNLVYQQIVRGIKFGEYRCEKNEDLASLAAQQYYIEHGNDLSIERLSSLLSQYIPDSCLAGSGMKERWTSFIAKAFKEAPYVQNRIDRNRVKEGLVMFAKYKWPLLFSKFFEAYRFSGPTLPQNDVIIAVNWTGVYFVDDQEHVLLETSFPEITNVTSSRTATGQSFTLITVKGEEYTFTSTNGEEICNLVNYFLDGLRKKSSFVIAMMDYQSPGEGSQFLSFKKGDLIVLENEDGTDISHSGWCYGCCERTGQRGDFPAECVYVLPTITKPPFEVLALFAGQSQQDVERIIATTKSALEDDDEDPSGGGTPYTLEKYSIDHFRVPKSRTLSGSIRGTLRRKSADIEIWAHNREPIKKPLLKRLGGQPEDVQQKACLSFLAILKYMGDYPSRKQRLSTELTDQVFEHALSNELLRDEIYCQLIKQLTANKLRTSEERGWELLWLATGLFPCSQVLQREINLFLRSRSKRWPIAADIQQRLYKSAHSGARRYPPHLVEVDAIQNKTTQIFHKVFFPDDSSQAFEVDSSTRSRDFCGTIAERLGLKFREGFSLFVKIGDKVISVPEADFFFDFVRHLTEWLRRARQSKTESTTNLNYKVFFMKKLWVNTAIGKDRKADVIFHYHQELPKYLRGYHKCTRDDAALLGSYIYRVKFGDTRSHFGEIPQMLRELVPHDMLREFHPEDWKRAIVANFSRHHARSSDEAKISFLKYVSRWETFGSAFFEVRQTTEPHFPDVLLIGLNKNGVMLIDPATKDILATHPFTMISNWSCGSNYFHMTIGNLLKGSRLLCETSLGYKMDDLLTSYISLVLANINKKQPGGGGQKASRR